MRQFYSSLTEAWSYVTRILLFEVNYALKSTLSTLTYTRNTPVELLRRYEEILSGRGDFYRHSIKTLHRLVVNDYIKGSGTKHHKVLLNKTKRIFKISNR